MRTSSPRPSKRPCTIEYITGDAEYDTLHPYLRIQLLEINLCALSQICIAINDWCQISTQTCIGGIKH